MHAKSKNSPNGPLISFEELYSLGNQWTLPQAALHTAMNLEIRLRTLTFITIYKGACALFQQTKNDGGKQSEKPNMPHIVTVRVFCYCWNRWFRGFNFESTRERTNHSSFSTSISAKKKVKQLQNVPVPQADRRDPTISIRAAIIANFQILKSDFLEWFYHGDGFIHCEVLLVTEKSAEATFMSQDQIFIGSGPIKETFKH